MNNSGPQPVDGVRQAVPYTCLPTCNHAHSSERVTAREVQLGRAGPVPGKCEASFQALLDHAAIDDGQPEGPV